MPAKKYHARHSRKARLRRMCDQIRRQDGQVVATFAGETYRAANLNRLHMLIFGW